MQKNIAIFLFLSIIAILVLNRCEEIENPGSTPIVKFIDFRTGIFYDDSVPYAYGEIEFEFTDGDADFGVYNYVPDDPETGYFVPDTVRNNLFLIPLTKKGKNNYVPAEPDGDTLKLKIYYDDKLNREGQYKIINGIITYRIPYVELPEYSLDTFAFKFFVYDRAFNKSEPDTTFDLCYKHLE